MQPPPSPPSPPPTPDALPDSPAHGEESAECFSLIRPHAIARRVNSDRPLPQLMSCLCDP
eukprot:623391-Prymnesium_polylepis.1